MDDLNAQVEALLLAELMQVPLPGRDARVKAEGPQAAWRVEGMLRMSRTLDAIDEAQSIRWRARFLDPSKGLGTADAPLDIEPAVHRRTDAHLGELLERVHPGVGAGFPDPARHRFDLALRLLAALGVLTQQDADAWLREASVRQDVLQPTGGACRLGGHPEPDLTELREVIPGMPVANGLTVRWVELYADGLIVVARWTASLGADEADDPWGLAVSDDVGTSYQVGGGGGSQADGRWVDAHEGFVPAVPPAAHELTIERGSARVVLKVSGEPR